jgi:hypothetical protein
MKFLVLLKESKIMSNELEWLQNYFLECCIGGWGNKHSISISTIANPGWAVEITLEDTNLEDYSFNELEIERNNDDWLICWVKEKKFHGRGGVQNLGEIISTFRDWVEENDRILAEKK